MIAAVMKLVACGFLFILWAVMDYLKMNDPQLILAIQACLASVIGYHAIENLQTVQKEPEPPKVIAPLPPQAGRVTALEFTALLVFCTCIVLLVYALFHVGY